MSTLLSMQQFQVNLMLDSPVRTRFNKFEGLLKIEEFDLPHPKWTFVIVDREALDFVPSRNQSRIIDYKELSLSPNETWTVRSCLVGAYTRNEFGLKRAVGISADQVASRLEEFSQYYQNLNLRAVFIVYPYFSADKSGIIEIRDSEYIIEAVKGSQWKLTEEGAPSESWLYTGRPEGILNAQFQRQSNGNVKILESKQLATLRSLIPHIHESKVLLEWTFTPEGNLFFYDMRPVRTNNTRIGEFSEVSPNLVGRGASPGVITGTARTYIDASKIRDVEPGQIIVLSKLTKDLSVLILKLPKNTGIITETGGVTSHPAIISREFGVPMVVGAESASAIIKDGQTVTMDGSTGRIYFVKEAN